MRVRIQGRFRRRQQEDANVFVKSSFVADTIYEDLHALSRDGETAVDFLCRITYVGINPQNDRILQEDGGIRMTQNSGMMKGLVIGLLAGSAIGAIVALLYAPKSGKELRADIRDKTDDLMENAEGYMEAAKSKASEMVSNAKKKSDQLITDAHSKAHSLLEDADKVISDAKLKAGRIVEEGTRVKDAVKAGMDAYKQERSRS
jgi:gas vesicle protein